MFIIARKSDEKIIKVSGTYADGQTPSKETMLPKIVKEFGGTIDDYEYLFVDDKSDAANRAMEGDSFSLIWKEESIDEKDLTKTTNKIDSVDFTPEDSKSWIKVTSDKSIVNTNDENDKATITFEVLKADKSGVDSTFQETIDLSIISPDKRIAYISLTFTKGKSVVNFMPTIFGRWVLMANSKRFNDFRIDNQIEIHARMPL